MAAYVPRTTNNTHPPNPKFNYGPRANSLNVLVTLGYILLLTVSLGTLYVTVCICSMFISRSDNNGWHIQWKIGLEKNSIFYIFMTWYFASWSDLVIFPGIPRYWFWVSYKPQSLYFRSVLKSADMIYIQYVRQCVR